MTFLGEVIAVVGSCEALGSWSYQNAVVLLPDGSDEYVTFPVRCPSHSNTFLTHALSSSRLLCRCKTLTYVFYPRTEKYGLQRSPCLKGLCPSIAISRVSFCSQRWADTPVFLSMLASTSSTSLCLPLTLSSLYNSQDLIQLNASTAKISVISFHNLCPCLQGVVVE